MQTLRPNPETEALLQILAEADELARGYFERGAAVQTKTDGSLVTEADLATEALILRGLRHHFPDDTLLSEETGAAHTAAPTSNRWVIDPIDGTSAFVEGLAHWGPSLARIAPDGRVLLAATSLPRLRETWWVAEGRGYHGGAALPALGAPTPPVLYVPSGLHRRVRLAWSGKARCIGGTAAHLALVARGSAAAALVGPDWKLWDVAAGLGLIESVGGVARRVSDGAPLHLLADTGAPFVAGNPAVVDTLLAQGAFAPLA